MQASFAVAASVSDVRNACALCHLVRFPEPAAASTDAPELELLGRGVQDDGREVAVHLRARASETDTALMTVELDLGGAPEATQRKLGEHIERTVTSYVRAPADFLFGHIAYLAADGLQNVDAGAFQRILALLTQVAWAEPEQVAARLRKPGNDLARVAAVEALGRAGQVEQLSEALQSCPNPLARVLAWNWLAKLGTTLCPWPLQPEETLGKVEFFVPAPGVLRSLASCGLFGVFFTLLLGLVTLGMQSCGGLPPSSSFLTHLAEARFVWLVLAGAFIAAIALGRWATHVTVDRYYDVAPGDVVALVATDRSAYVFGWIKPSTDATNVRLRELAQLVAGPTQQGFFLEVPRVRPRRFAPMAFPPRIEDLLQP